jgi:PEGA domain
MKMKILIPLIGIILCGAILFSSCASTTLMQSIPTGAKLYMNDEPVGTTPFAYTDTKIVGSKTPFRMVLDGYQDYNGILIRNEEANVGAIIGGVLLLFPFLWTMDYKPNHTYELIPVKK